MKYPPELVIESDGEYVLLTCVTCDGLHHAFLSGTSVDLVLEAVDVHQYMHLNESRRNHD